MDTNAPTKHSALAPISNEYRLTQNNEFSDKTGSPRCATQDLQNRTVNIKQLFEQIESEEAAERSERPRQPGRQPPGNLKLNASSRRKPLEPLAAT